MGAVDPRHAGVASGINNAVSRTAGVLAIAIFGILAAAAFETGLEDRLSDLNLAATDRTAVLDQRDRLADAEPPAGLDSADRDGVESAIDEAFVDGFRLVMLVSAGLAVASAVVASATIATKRVTRGDAATGGTAKGSG
jgi:hypothetical protein